MKKKLKRIQEFLDTDEALFELANLDKFDTGLPMMVWIGEKRGPHGPRVKVARTYNHRTIAGDSFSVSIVDKPKIVAGDQGVISNKDVKKVINWILLNKTMLLQYWDSKIITREMFELLQKL